MLKQLSEEQPQYRKIEIPKKDIGAKKLLRSLMNICPPKPACVDFHKKYGITDMYSGGFYPYDTLEEY